MMVVFSGGKASGFKNVHDRDEYDEDGVRMFRIQCASGETDARATQVEEKASSLDSDDVFILETPGKTWIWSGKEGEEQEEFWNALGGKAEYNTTDPLTKPILLPRLFHLVVRPSGSMRAFEIFNFGQSDLVEDDVMFLDSGDEVYIWIGKDASNDEKEKSLELAKKYLDSDPTERSAENSTIISVKQGEEPESFLAIISSS